MRALGADGRGDASAEMAGGANIPGECGMNFAELGNFVHGGLVDFFLSVKAGPHGPFVEQMEERAGFREANGFGVGEKVESNFRGNTAVKELILCGPSVFHGAVENFAGARIIFQEHGSDVVGLAGIGEGEQRT